MKNLKGRYLKYIKGSWGSNDYPIGSFHLIKENLDLFKASHILTTEVIDCNGFTRLCFIEARIRDREFELMPEGFIPNQQLTYILF